MRGALPRMGVAGLLLAMLAACWEEPVAPSQASRNDQQVAVAAEAAGVPLRARLRLQGELRQRGVQVFPQAIQGNFAVCGRAARSSTPGDAFLPYVAVVAFEGDVAQVTDFVIGITGPEAARVFIALAERCFDGGGPPHPRAVAGPLPVLPTWTASEMEPASMASPIETANAAQPGLTALRKVVTTSIHGANIRSAPGGRDVVRVAPRSTRLDVYGEAPGGWLHVGADDVAWGWLHTSVLDAAHR